MDLTIKLDTHTLNIRVHIILQTEKGYLFFKSKSGHYALVGGRIKLGESSLVAAQRELQEETGLNLSLDKFKLISIIENFYEAKDRENENDKSKFQEIGFTYLVNEKINKIDDQFIQEFSLKEFTKEEIQSSDIRPEIIKKLILEDKLETFTHHVV